jgi:hypothetical protein
MTVALAGLSPTEKRALAAWTLSNAGGEGGELFVPNAVRRLPLEERLGYALNPPAAAAWQVRERRRVVASPVYFSEAYGHLQGNVGPPIPFDLWPLVDRAAELAIGARTQAEVLDVLWRERRVLMLKARQLGMTWLVLHYAYWVLAFRTDTPRARILALSKHGGDASKLLERTRRIRELLPPFLRHDEAKDTRGSKSELELEGRGKMLSLAGDPAAARQETATLALVDEAAFVRNQQAGPTLTALASTIGEEGQEIVLSTGNGQTGDGEAFAEEVGKALRGDSDRVFVFLPADTDPRRDDAWRDKEIRNYRSDEDFEQENPRTVEHALGGQGIVRIYPARHLQAAREIGQAIADLDGGDWRRRLAEAEGHEIGTDWGDFQTFTTWGVGLPRAGLYVVDELLQRTTEPTEASEAILDYAVEGEPPGRVVRSSADAAPPGTNRTYARVLSKRRGREPGRWPDTHVLVPFGVYKQGGSGKKGVNTVGYLQYLLRQAWLFTQRDGWQDRIHEAGGLLAIHPRCKTLLVQMGELEKDPKTGKVKKPTPDPKRPEKGDHGPDSLVAMAHRRAELHAAVIEADQETTREAA